MKTIMSLQALLWGLLEEKCSFWSFSALLRSNFKVNEWMWKWLSESHCYVKHSGSSSAKCSASNWLKQCFSTFVTCPHLWQYTGVLREGNLNFLQFCSVGHSAKIQQNSLESIGCCCLLFPPVSCQRCRCLAFVGRVCFCLTEHRQNFLSCSPFTALLNHTHTHKHKARSVFPSSVCSKWRVTASPPPRSRAASFIFTKLEREMEKIKDGESSRQRWMDCEKRRLYSEIESYIKRNRGREKIRGLEGKSGETSIETGHIKWNRKWQWHTVMRWGNRLRVCVCVWEMKERG